MSVRAYDAYVTCLFSTDDHPLWAQQTMWSCVRGPDTRCLVPVPASVRPTDQLVLQKSTKSAFEVDANRLENFLTRHRIEEVHLVGADTNDCILATAYAAFDRGFFAYVLEECVCASGGAGQHRAGLTCLRHAHLTNHAVVEPIAFDPISASPVSATEAKTKSTSLTVRRPRRARRRAGSVSING